MQRTFRLDAAATKSFTGLAVTAAVLDLTVTSVLGLTEATVELTGPADVVGGATAIEGDVWKIGVPAPRQTGSVRSFAGGAVIQARNITNGVIFNGGMRLGGMTLGGNGVTTVVQDPIRAVVRIPKGTGLTADITHAGSVLTRGWLSSIRISGTAVDVDLAGADHVDVKSISGDLVLERATGSARLRSTSGDVAVHCAGATTDAESVSGDITVTAGTEDSRVYATTVSGDVTVTRGGYRVSTQTSSVSGRVREW